MAWFVRYSGGPERKNMNTLTLPPAQLRDTMSRLPYFRGWDPCLVARLAGAARQFVAAKEEPLLTKGEVPESLYVVIGGQVRLFIPLSNGMERIISLVAPGEGYGEVSLLLNGPLPYAVSACRSSHIVAIHGHTYLRELGAVPAMQERTLKLIAKQFHTTLQDMEICSQPSSVQKVIRYLMNLQPSPETTDYSVNLPGRKRDIASKLGLTQETFSRVLGFLGQQGVITVKGGEIRIDTAAKLRQMNAAICDKDMAKA